MIGLSPLADTGTQTPDTLAYRRWQHEETGTSLRRERIEHEREEGERRRILVTIAAVLALGALFVVSAYLPRARAEGARTGDFTASEQIAIGSAAVLDPPAPPPSTIPLGTVRVTTYKANAWETDGDPSHTASGARVAPGQIGVSREFLWRNGGALRWGDRVKLTDPDGPAACNATYEVQDVMNSRWRKRVDIFIAARDRYFSCYNVTLEKVM